MLKRLSVLLAFAVVLNTPLKAQQTSVKHTYQAFRPFIHFQLDFKSYGYNYDTHEMTYFKGYMDGVNNEHFFGYGFADLVQNINTYLTGYRDGSRDRKLLIQLRGITWYTKYQFARDDYYAPDFAIRIWLERLSLAFLQAPAQRLPKRWTHQARSQLKKYRKLMAHNHNHENDYSRSTDIERKYQKRIRRYEQKLDRAKKQRRQVIFKDRKQADRKRYHQNNGIKPLRADRSDNRRSESAYKNESRSRETVNRDAPTRERRREIQKRIRETNESKRNRNRSRDSDG